MDAKQSCSFFLLRYVPDAVKSEFINFGLVLMPPAAPAELRFSKDWSRVQALDPQADLVSIVYSFAARLYGQRRAKRKTEAIVKQLQEADD